MGTFAGHVLPGSFFILFSLWHALMVCIRYFQSKRPDGPIFKSRTFYTASICGGFPVESLLKVVSCTVGIIGETYTALDKRGRFVEFGNAQHIAMFFFFGLTGLVEMLHHYRFHLPPNSTYLANILAFIIEYILFHFHLHGREDMDVQMHELLNMVVFSTVVCISVEMYMRNSVLPALCRCYLILLQGLWFWQVAFIMFPRQGMEHWDMTNHMQMMLVTVIFTVHAGLAFLVIFCIWFLVSCVFGNCRRELSAAEMGYNSVNVALRVLKRKNEGERLIHDEDMDRSIEDDEDEEELFATRKYT